MAVRRAKPNIRELVAGALYPTKAYNLPAVCVRYGLAPGEESEAFSSKHSYVMRRLETLVVRKNSSTPLEFTCFRKKNRKCGDRIFRRLPDE